MKSRVILFIYLYSHLIPFLLMKAVLFFSVFKYIYISFDFNYQQFLDMPEFLVVDPKIPNKYDLDAYIKQKKPITVDSFRYFIQNNPSDLLAKYKKIKPNKHRVQYHRLVPFHSNGYTKKEVNYKDFLSYENIVIKHFTSYLNNTDKYIDNRRFFLIDPSDDKNITISNNKITLVYLLTVSKPSKFLIREIKALSHPEVAFILFLDNKMNRNYFYPLFESEKNNEQFSNVYFIDSPRFQVQWAQITQTLAQLVTIKACLKYFKNSLYLSCHSDSDYPIKSTKYILNFLKKNYPKNFIYTIPRANESWKKDRKDFFLVFHGELRRFVSVINKLFPKKFTPIFKWRTGWNWLTITTITAQKMVNILTNRFELIDSLEFVMMSDEIIFSTLIEEANASCVNRFLRFIKWPVKGPHPLILNESNFDELTKVKCDLWARKFNLENSSKLLDMLDKYNNNYNENASFNCNF